MNRAAILLLGAMAGCWSEALLGAEQESAMTSATIRLTNGDYVAGQLVDCDRPGTLLWQSPHLVGALEFDGNSVNRIDFPVPAKLPQPKGEFCFELAGGDLLFGSLATLSAEELSIDVPDLGLLRIERKVVCRIYRTGGGDLIYLGPSGLAGWDRIGGTPPWREDGAQLLADQFGATIRRDFDLPPQARFEIGLSWHGKPDFSLYFGVGPDPKLARQAFRIEPWDGDLVVVRETDHTADVARLQAIASPGPGHIDLQVFLDQSAGRMMVYSARGEKLGDLRVPSDEPQIQGGLQIMNKAGDVLVERLGIGRWNGEPPSEVQGENARIHKTDGTLVYGQLKSYDAATREFVIENEGRVDRVAHDQVHDLFLSIEKRGTQPSIMAVHSSGLRLSGELLKVEANKVWLQCPGVKDLIPSPIESLHALTVLFHSPEVPKAFGREGRLELDGLLLHGYLVDSQQNGGSCFVWQPLHGKPRPAGLARGSSGRIVYRDPLPKVRNQANASGVRLNNRVAARNNMPNWPMPAAAIQGRMVGNLAVNRLVPNGAAPGGVVANAGVINGVVVQEQRAAAVNPDRKPQGAPSRPVLHLLCGDTISCTVKSIDEHGLTISAGSGETTLVPHARIAALELMPDAAVVSISKYKRDRLMTLPRMQRDNPPTHLIRSIDGDYLRGRLVGLNDKEIEIEVRLDVKTIPRQRVARIIWLHADAPSAADAGQEKESEKKEQEKPVDNLVQAVSNDGRRLTFAAQELKGTTLIGRSDVLGACQIDIEEVDQILLGSAIDKAAAVLAFHGWTLTPALEPIEPAPQGAGGEGSSGLESGLVGKPAPEFELELLDGKKFRLTDQKDKITVLDFWASWCGPCLQVMPQVSKVAAEFGDRGVQLVAVNLQESPDKIKAALDRLKIEPAVALDHDGRVAEQYGATAIPQTVIIDRQGQIARLFVGGSPHFDQTLREAIQSVIDGKPAPAEGE